MKLADELGLSSEHVNSLKSIDSYIEKNRISELFNELLANVLQERPEDARSYMLQQLKNLQKKDFSKEDNFNKNIYQF